MHTEAIHSSNNRRNVRRASLTTSHLTNISTKYNRVLEYRLPGVDRADMVGRHSGLSIDLEAQVGKGWNVWVENLLAVYPPALISLLCENADCVQAVEVCCPLDSSKDASGVGGQDDNVHITRLCKPSPVCKEIPDWRVEHRI